jgi:hypothetical protein
VETDGTRLVACGEGVMPSSWGARGVHRRGGAADEASDPAWCWWIRADVEGADYFPNWTVASQVLNSAATGALSCDCDVS